MYQTDIIRDNLLYRSARHLAYGTAHWFAGDGVAVDLKRNMYMENVL